MTGKTMKDRKKQDSANTLPEGVRDILGEEAAAVSRVEGGVARVFSSHGFQRVITPLIEYADVLGEGLGEELEGEALKFIEAKTGKVLCLRPDITPQIARMVATRMRHVPLPLKLCYKESVMRSGTGTRSTVVEIIQAGAEYVSERPSPEIDAEVVTVAIEALKETGLTDFKIDLGDVSFVRAALKAAQAEEKDEAALRKAVAVKDRPALEKLLKGKGLAKADAGAKELLLALPGFYGEEEVLEKAKSFELGTEAAAAIKNLEEVVAIIGDKGYGDYITIDLGEARGFDYYTGIIFEGFSASLGKPILGGGRYDTLLSKYGYEAASTGFALNVGNIVSLLGK